MKLIIRLIILYIMISHAISFLITSNYSRGIEIYQTDNWAILIWGCIYVFSVFCMWVYFLHHWGIGEFINIRTKRKWFWVITLGGLLYFVGPLMYYIFVYELGRGLERKPKNEGI